MKRFVQNLHVFLISFVAILFPLSCAAQQSYTGLEIRPPFPYTSVGTLRFVDSNDYPGATHYVGLKAPADVTTNYDIELPAAPPSANRCMEMTSAGVIVFSTTACNAASAGHPFPDSSIWVQDDGDATKQAQIQASGISTGTTRTYTLPDASGTLAMIDIAQTFTADQTFRNIFFSLDSTYNIGVKAGNRVQWGFADVWNADDIQISNSIHTKHWGIQNNSTDLEFYDEDGELVMEIEESSSLVQLSIGISGGGPKGALRLYSAGGTIRSAVLSADTDPDGIVAGFEFSQAMWSASDSTIDIGFEGRLWKNIWATEYHAGNPGVTGTRRQGILRFANADATANAVASFSGDVANSGTAAEHAVILVDNLVISESGNFYIRFFSGGDISCTDIDNVWIGVRTDTNELQTCINGALKKVALT